MTSKQYFEAGKLAEAIQALGAEVRDNPSDARRRTFLFELLCFAGEYARAEKQLSALVQGDTKSEMGAILYYSALHAEKLRQEMFAKQEYPDSATAAPVAATVNGQPVQMLSDADPRIGPKLEVYAAGAYLWIPFEHIERIEIAPPKRLRDLLWSQALVKTGPSFKGKELGEVLMPVLCPGSSKHADGNVQLGRVTVWETDESGQEAPFGQKMLLADGEEIPILEVRTIEIQQAQVAAS